MTEPTNKRQRQDDTTVSLTLDQCKLLQESFKSIADLMRNISKLKAEADTPPVSINDERIVMKAKDGGILATFSKNGYFQVWNEGKCVYTESEKTTEPGYFLWQENHIAFRIGWSIYIYEHNQQKLKLIWKTSKEQEKKIKEAGVDFTLMVLRYDGKLVTRHEGQTRHDGKCYIWNSKYLGFGELDVYPDWIEFSKDGNLMFCVDHDDDSLTIWSDEGIKLKVV